MEAGKTYHIYTHANGSENLFQTDENFRYFLKRYQEFIPPVADTLAWCLMPNHLHLLVQIKSSKDLTGLAGESKKDLSGLDNEKTLERLTILQFSHLFNAYTKAYNKFKKKKEEARFLPELLNDKRLQPISISPTSFTTYTTTPYTTGLLNTLKIGRGVRTTIFCYPTSPLPNKKLLTGSAIAISLYCFITGL